MKHKHKEDRFTGSSGLRIYWQCWLPERIRAVVVIAHGAGEHSGRYRYFVEHMLPRGYAIYAVDHRGHGHSEGVRGLINPLDLAVADLDTLVQQARHEQPGLPLFLLGHSLGGAIALWYALIHQQQLTGLVVSAPALSVEGAPPVLKPLAKLLTRVAPKLPVFQVDPATISRDPAEVAAYANDPLMLHTKLPVGTVAEVVRAVEQLPGRLPEVKLPLLVIHGGGDKLVPPAGGKLAYEHAGSKDKTLRIYDGLFHEMFNEFPADRARVLADVGNWIDSHLAA